MALAIVIPAVYWSFESAESQIAQRVGRRRISRRVRGCSAGGFKGGEG